MRIETVSFEGHECARLDDEATTVLVSTSVGPRILGLIGPDGNVLAILPDLGLERPDGGRSPFFGGHRLWAAPEVPEITYQADDRPCEVTEVESGVRVESPPDGAELIKAIEVRRGSRGWTVDHVLRNASRTPVTIAPWAITQCRLGGDVVLPTAAEEAGPRANRSLVLWPYTDLGDPRVRFGRVEVRVAATPGGASLKLGAAPSEGCVSYRLGRTTFEKRIMLDPNAPYADRGAAVQVYVCDDFCELETLGPLRELAPGGSATHREAWSLRHHEPHGSGGGPRSEERPEA